MNSGLETPLEFGFHHNKQEQEKSRSSTCDFKHDSSVQEEQPDVRSSREQQGAAEVTAALIAIPRISVNARRQRLRTSR